MPQRFTRFVFHPHLFLSCFVLTALILFFVKTSAQTIAPNAAAPPKSAAADAASPTATVQTFYELMRGRRFRDALLMTNLRAAVENLSTADLADLALDFEPLAARVPEKLEFSGEQISSNAASVFVKTTNPANGEPILEELKMRREKNAWTILTGDDAAEAEAKREANNYFFKLRLATRHSDVDLTMQDIIKAELVHSLQNNALYGDLQALVDEKLIPADIMNPDVMGYKFRLQLSADKRKYTVNAEPVVYGKTGKLSFIVVNDGKTSPQIQNGDKNGAPLAAKK